MAALRWDGLAALAQTTRFFRLATGTPSGTYFPIGALIAGAISNPPGGPSCEHGGSCGVPGLIAVAQASSGAIENIDLLRAGAVDAAFTQSDTAYWAWTGTGPFSHSRPFAGLRSIGALYTEAIHLVVRADSTIHSPLDIKGRTVSIGESASGTRADVRIILDAYGLTGALTELNLRLGTAADRLARCELDGFFIVGGTPVGAVAELAAQGLVRLVPIDDDIATDLRRKHRFLQPVLIAGGVYPGVEDTVTLGVGAELVTTDQIDADLIHAITGALWNEATRRLLVEGHPRSRSFSPTFAATAPAIPLHAGAERHYRESGIIEQSTSAP